MMNPVHAYPSAYKIAQMMALTYGYEIPDFDQLRILERQLYRLGIRYAIGQAGPKLPTSRATIKELETLHNAIRRIDSFAHADDKASKRARRYFDNQATYDEYGEYISPLELFEVAKKFLPTINAAIKDARNNLDADLDETLSALMPAPLSGRTWKTEYIGNKLPGLYVRIYPSGLIGARNDEGQLSGPLYDFVSMCFHLISGDTVTSEAIYSARRLGSERSTNN